MLGCVLLVVLLVILILLVSSSCVFIEGLMPFNDISYFLLSQQQQAVDLSIPEQTLETYKALRKVQRNPFQWQTVNHSSVPKPTKILRFVT